MWGYENKPSEYEATCAGQPAATLRTESRRLMPPLMSSSLRSESWAWMASDDMPCEVVQARPAQHAVRGARPIRAALTASVSLQTARMRSSTLDALLPPAAMVPDACSQRGFQAAAVSLWLLECHHRHVRPASSVPLADGSVAVSVK